MSRKPLVLIASDKMDSNKKKDRNENGLIRMPAKVRKSMGFSQESVEIYPGGNTNDRIAKSQLLEIFQAFSGDIKKVNQMVADGKITKEEATRVGFVTTYTLNKINGTKRVKKVDNIWISNTIHDTVIGSDPEFLLFEGDKVIHAGSKMSHAGELGSDGAMAELRPKPSITVIDHIDNIASILKYDKNTKAIADYKWMSGCYYKDDMRDYPIGGHIHIGNPAKIAKMPQRDRFAFFRVVNKILDELLSLPLTKLDGSDEGKRRRTNCRVCTTGNGGYGFFGEWRPCEGRLEHRTLSGMWLMHPSLTKAVLGTAKAIIDEVFRLVSDREFNIDYMCLNVDKGDGREVNKSMWKKGFDGWKDIGLARDMGCISSSDRIINWLNESKPSRVNKLYLNKWLDIIKRFSTYKDNSHYIRGLHEILNISGKELTGFNRDLQENWLKNKKFLVEV
jgi:hypothetical protein